MYPPHAYPYAPPEHLVRRHKPAPVPSRYRLIPVEVDVVQVPLDPEVNIETIRVWCCGTVVDIQEVHCIRVSTEGPLDTAYPGDYILKKPRSTEVFVIRQGDFHEHYEKVFGYR